MKKLSLILLALLAVASTAWAQEVHVSNQSELTSAVSTGGYIYLEDDITTLTSHLTIPANKTVIINMQAHTLSRSLSSGTDMGCVIIVAATGNLTISNGTLSGGWNSHNDGTHTAGCLVNKGTATLNNVTISGCKGVDGGAIMNADNATLNITGGSISNCTSNAGGGGIVNKGTATITDCTLSSNTATSRGGAIWSNNSLTVSGCTITGNTATNNDGGALHLETGTATLINVTITNNSSKDAGGIYVKADATLTMTGTNTISDNISSEHGGGGLVNYGTTTLSGSTFSGNTAKTSGGAIWSKSSLTVSDCTFDDNEAYATGGDEQNEGNGGAIHLEGGTATLTDVTITNNTSKDAGGIFVKSSATLNLGGTTGSTLSGNTSSEHGGGGIVNEGTANLSGSVSITGNTSHTFGGGIWNNSTLNLQGTIVVTNNTTDNNGTQNLYINQDKVISFTGALASGCNIGLSRTVGYYNFAYSSGFSTNNPQFSNGDPVAYLTDDIDPTNYQFVASDELFRCPVNYGTDVEDADYINDNGVALTRPACIKVSSITDNASATLYPGWYVVDTDKTFNNRITVEGVVHLILKNGTTLNANKGIFIPQGSHLHVWANSTDENLGHLNANVNKTMDSDDAAIGGNFATSGGNVTIHGGFIEAYSHGGAAGIGGGGGAAYFQSITIKGGFITASGDVEVDQGYGGAGIGGGAGALAPDITITGGDVLAMGGANGAGIGSGWFGHNHIGAGEYWPGPSLCKTILISGGSVTAFGGAPVGLSGGGAGIGGGATQVGPQALNQYDGLAGNIYIDGGTVLAYTIDPFTTGDPAQAIGHGHIHPNNASSVMHGDTRIYDGAMVRATTEVLDGAIASATPLGKDARLHAICDLNYFYKSVYIAPCDHSGATYDGSGSAISINGCNWCSQGTMPFTFESNGEWSTAANWFQSLMPHEGNDVAVCAAATIPHDCTAHVGHIDMQDGGSLTIADGGQLLHTNEGVVATVQKSISGHSNGSNGGWYFIASPMVANITPAEGNGFLTNEYDLYYYDEPNYIWRNYKPSEHSQHPGFSIEPQKGYLYANNLGTTLSMTGTLQPSNASVTINGLSHAATTLTGWNLVGNPFACNATIDKPCYTISGTAINTTANGANVYQIAPCEAVMVQADATNESVTFTRVDPASQASHPNNGNMQIMLTQANTRSAEQIDNAIVSFNEGEQLGKFYFGEQNANIYIPQDGKEYAIVNTAQEGELPVNFKAEKNGTYTLTINVEGLDLAYLHLIDNMTGADVDLLATSSYTFTAKTTDYESRFKLVFAVKDGPSTGSGTFAFISDGNIIVNGEGVLQVVDVMGRIIISTNFARNVSTSGMTPGVYVLRLIDENDVRTQKIVIK